jgi:hypothetical protein
VVLALGLCSGVAAQPAVGSPPPGQAPSLIEIPVRIPLERLYELAEREMPRQAGNWRGWRQTYGVDTRYRAWRGPLQFSLRGEVLTVQAHVRYWIQAHKEVLGTLDLESSCGVDEPPRQAVIGVQIRLGWGPDWMLRPAFRVLPTRFLDRCEMTIADIDVTPLIGKEFQQQLEERMRAALAGLAPRLQAIRGQAERDWSLLQEPVALWADQWLLLRPRGVALSPLAGVGNRLDAKLAVLLAPEVVSGARPDSGGRPLPPLLRYYPRAPGLHLRLTVELDYTDLGRAMTEMLADQTIEIGAHRAHIDAIALTGQGQEIRAELKLGGPAAGEAVLTAKPVFNPETRRFALENLDYSYRPEDPLLEAEANFLRGYIRKLLVAAANRQLELRMQQGQARLQGLLERITPAGTRLDMSGLQLRRVTFELTAEAMRLNALASGRIGLEFSGE